MPDPLTVAGIALGAGNLIGSVFGNKKANDRADKALGIELQRYRDAAPFRNAAEDVLRVGIPAAPDLGDVFADPSSPFYRETPGLQPRLEAAGVMTGPMEGVPTTRPYNPDSPENQGNSSLLHAILNRYTDGQRQREMDGTGAPNPGTAPGTPGGIPVPDWFEGREFDDSTPLLGAIGRIARGQGVTALLPDDPSLDPRPASGATLTTPRPPGALTTPGIIIDREPVSGGGFTPQGVPRDPVVQRYVDRSRTRSFGGGGMA